MLEGGKCTEKKHSREESQESGGICSFKLSQNSQRPEGGRQAERLSSGRAPQAGGVARQSFRGTDRLCRLQKW